MREWITRGIVWLVLIGGAAVACCGATAGADADRATAQPVETLR